MKKLLLLPCLVLFSALVHAQNNEGIQFLDETNGHIHLRCDVNGIHTANTADGTIIRLTDGTVMLEVGQPELPLLTSSVIVDDSREMQIEIVASDYVEYSDIDVVPSKGNLIRTVDPNSLPYTYGSAYATDAFYPGELASLGTAFVQGHFRGQSVHFYPVQYNPVTHKVRVYSNIEIQVTPTEEPGLNALPSNTPQKMDLTQQEAYKSHFANFSAHGDRYDAIGELGNMLVIYDAEYIEELEPWIQWKREKGIEVYLQDVATINSISAINNYVSDFYTQNGLTYLVLVGDEDQVPSQLLNNSGGQGYCDPCYGYVSGNDSYVEFFVGRLLVHTDSELPAVISKILEYEKNPNMIVDWFSVAMGIGSNEGAGIGDDNQADWQHNNGIKEDLLAYTYTEVWEKYDGTHGSVSPSGGTTADASGSPSNSSLTTVINGGCSLINYTGHGAHNLIVTGSYTNTQINQLTNHGFYPFFIIVGCCTGDFDDDDASGDTFGEAWLKCPTANYANPTGGIGGSFSSVYQSWAPPMEGQDEMNKVICETSQAGNTRHTFGSIHYHGCHGMNDAYGNSGDEMTDTWILMADPSVQLRTAYPSNIIANHPSTIFFGTTELSVSCTSEEALVALTMDGVILATGLVSNGNVTLTFDALTTPGTLLLTVTNFNTIPYQANIEIIAAEGPFVVNNSVGVQDLSGNNNGLADYNEAVMLDVPATNVGVEDAINVVGVLTTENPNVTITDNTYDYGTIAIDGTANSPEGYAFVINGYIEDQTIITFTVTYTDENGNTWAENFNITIQAPAIVCGDGLEINDSAGNNNGRLDLGETVTITYPVTNDGHAATGVNLIATLASDSPYFSITQNTSDLGIVGAGSTVYASFTAMVSADAPVSALANLVLTTNSDSYGSECPSAVHMNQQVEDWETGDMSQYAWVNEDDVYWFVTNTQPYEGSNCMQSGDIANNGLTTLKITLNVLEAGQISFAYRTDCDAADLLKFRIGTATFGQYGGDNDWTTVSHPIGTGTKVLRWIYDKDFAASLGADAVWIDDIIFPNSQIISAVVEYETIDGLDVYPNPAQDQATVELALDRPSEVVVRIENLLGEIVFEQNYNQLPQGTHLLPVEMTQWSSGMYVVRVDTGAEMKSMKLVKK